MKVLRLLPVILVTLLLAPSVQADPLAPTLTYPVNGAVNADMSQPVTWTSVASAQAYYLWVGTTVGTSNLVNTGEVQSTSYLASGLPSGQTLYARVWARVGGVWHSNDSTFSAAASVPLAPTLTYPVNGAVNADMTQPMTWTTVANAQAYYLYVGTTVGASNLVNSGETQATSRLAAGLPSGQTLYARVWAKVGGVWRSNDSTFSAAPSVPLAPTLTYPVNGAVNANLTQPITWTTVANAQAYYLYVGTTLGASNLVNTGEIQTTSRLVTGLPISQTLYARVWAKVGGVWRSTDSTFSVAVPQAPTLTYPANGAVNADMTQPMTWTTVASAQAYYLYVGTTLGASNLVNSGEIQTTSRLATGLPSGQTLYARVWAEVGGVWRSSDSTFTAAASVPLTAALIYPADGATQIDQTLPATWNSVPNAQAYYLYVGSTPGTHDVIDSQETGLTSFSIVYIPAGQTLYARLWTKVGGVWRYRDSTFTAAPIAPVFVYPTDGATGVDGSQPIQWTPPANAQAHELHVGTTPGGSDLFDSGQISATSVLVTGLPATGALYARVLSLAHGVWSHTDIAFTLESSSPSSAILTPFNGQTGFDTARPFEWTPAPLARGYRLKVGTTLGGSDLHDSGVIRVTQRFVPNLPIGPLFGRLETRINGQWYASDFTFSVGANTASTTLQIKTALWATDFVRSMSLSDNRPFTWTQLADKILERRALRALCNDYAETLLQVLTEVNLQIPAKRLDISLNSNTYDAHTLVEMFNPATASWMLLDPTFDVSVKRTSDGEWATAEDVSAATNTQQWGDVSYEFLGSLDDFYLRNYYLDYPILFVNVYHDGATVIPGQGAPALPFMEPVPMPVSTYGNYAIGCSGDGTASLTINGVDTTVDCSGVDGLSYIFGASAIAPNAQTTGSVSVYRPRRFVF